MDLENQKRVKEFADEFGPENLVVVLGAAEGEAAESCKKDCTAGDPTFPQSIDRSPTWTHDISRL